MPLRDKIGITMRTNYLFGLAMASIVLVSGCKPASDDSAAAPEQTPAELTGEEARYSYAMGANLGARLKAQNVAVDAESFARGFNDGIQGGETAMTQDEMVQALQDFQQQQMEKMSVQLEAQAEKNKQEAEAFLAENAKKEGIVTTDTGLQYKVLTEAEGDRPGVNDVVNVHYRGTLLDGTEFDSSYARGAPVKFPVDGVIPGWTEALQLMPVGSKWQLFIPSKLAYGPGGTSGGPIGPNAALIFEVELLSIENADEDTADEDS